jgi:hypothetical protein
MSEKVSALSLLQRFLKCSVIQGLFRHYLLEPAVFFFQGF